MRSLSHLSLFLFIILLPGISLTADTQLSKSNSCQAVVSELNQSLGPKIDEEELVSVLRTLNKTRNKRLPEKFITKKQAQKMGWRPGKNLWNSKALHVKAKRAEAYSTTPGLATKPPQGLQRIRGPARRRERPGIRA